MISLIKKWDTLLILVLITSILGGSTWSAKSYLDLDKVVVDESPFYKQLVTKKELEKFNIKQAILPTLAIINKDIKAFFDKDGNILKDTNPQTNNNSQGAFVFSPATDKYLLGQAPRLKELVPTPINPEKFNHLYYPRFEVNANIVYSQPSDYDIIDVGNPCSIKSMNTPIQKLVRQGIVHIYGSPLPGEVRYPEDSVEYYGKDTNGIQLLGTGIGSAYIVGHSSECTQHAYTKIFEPLQQKSSIGDEFYIWDQVGRKLKFRVFEVLEVKDTDTKTAYKEYPDRRIVTLQTSIFYSATNINRWLTRGELVDY
jgi:Sortase domain